MGLGKLLALDFHLLEFGPLRATSYIPIPTCIQNRKTVININNKDENCFLVCISKVYCCVIREGIQPLRHFISML